MKEKEKMKIKNVCLSVPFIGTLASYNIFAVNGESSISVKPLKIVTQAVFPSLSLPDKIPPHQQSHCLHVAS